MSTSSDVPLDDSFGPRLQRAFHLQYVQQSQCDMSLSKQNSTVATASPDSDIDEHLKNCEREKTPDRHSDQQVILITTPVGYDRNAELPLEPAEDHTAGVMLDCQPRLCMAMNSSASESDSNPGPSAKERRRRGEDLLEVNSPLEEPKNESRKRKRDEVETLATVQQSVSVARPNSSERDAKLYMEQAAHFTLQAKMALESSDIVPRDPEPASQKPAMTANEGKKLSKNKRKVLRRAIEGGIGTAPPVAQLTKGPNKLQAFQDAIIAGAHPKDVKHLLPEAWFSNETEAYVDTIIESTTQPKKDVKVKATSLAQPVRTLATLPAPAKKDSTIDSKQPSSLADSTSSKARPAFAISYMKVAEIRPEFTFFYKKIAEYEPTYPDQGSDSDGIESPPAHPDDYFSGEDDMTFQERHGSFPVVNPSRCARKK